jgi:aspartate-semialdehyde dehydrogenase
MIEVAIVGASGAVGRQMLKDLEESGLNCRVRLFASPRSAGTSLAFRGESLKVETYELQKLAGIKFALMSAGGEFSLKHAQEIAALGIAVIDNSSAWRMKPDIPLVVPEVNGYLLKGFRAGIIANPNCSTIQLVVSLKPLHDRFTLKTVHVSTYQSVSGSGQKGIAELKQQMAEYDGDEGFKGSPNFYPKLIIGNVIPAIDVLTEGGHCKEEEKVVRETRKILGLEDLEVLATTARVPTLNCHCEAVTVELNKEVSLAEAYEAMTSGTSLVVNNDQNYAAFPYPHDVAGKAEVFVARLRLPLGKSRSSVVQYWNVADNLRKGAATNAVQILKLLV